MSISLVHIAYQNRSDMVIFWLDHRIHRIRSYRGSRNPTTNSQDTIIHDDWFKLHNIAWCLHFSSCDPEQHKQFSTRGGGLLCLSPVPGLLPVSFTVTLVTKDEVRLGFGGSFVPFGGLFLFAIVSVVVIATAPANPGSFLICSLSFDKLGMILQTWILSLFSNGMRYASPLVDQVVG